MSKNLQTDDMSEFLALAEHYRALLQETHMSAALIRRVEQRREQAPPKTRLVDEPGENSHLALRKRA